MLKDRHVSDFVDFSEIGVFHKRNGVFIVQDLTGGNGSMAAAV